MTEEQKQKMRDCQREYHKNLKCTRTYFQITRTLFD